MTRLLVTVQWQKSGLQDFIAPLMQVSCAVPQRDRLMARLPTLIDYGLLRVAKGLSAHEVDEIVAVTGYSVATVTDLILVGNREGLGQ